MFKTALLIACAIVVWHMVYFYGYIQMLYLEMVPGSGTGQYNLFYWVLPIDCISDAYTLFFNLFPLIACLPYAWSYTAERGTSYSNQLICRCGAYKYVFSKFFAVFLSGGIVIAIPLLVDLLGMAMFLPASVPEVTFPMPGFYHGHFLSGIYYSHPWLFCLLFIGMDFLWAGTVASMSFVVASLFKSKVLSVVLPTIVIFACDILSVYPKGIYYRTTGKTLEFSILRLFHANTLNPNPAWLQLSLLALILVISASVAFTLAKENDRL